jgi:hypothetical protein
MLALLVAPAVWTADTAGSSIPAGQGPFGSAPPGQPFTGGTPGQPLIAGGNAATTRQVLRYWVKNQDTTPYLVVTSHANSAAASIIKIGQSVLLLGGGREAARAASLP